ncbi:MAG: AbrB family transcriptional regulator, partial [Rhodospirillaceae bacterium]
MSAPGLTPLTRSFLLPLVPATAGGALWAQLGLPLGWLMGAALVIGGAALLGFSLKVPKPCQSGALIVIGAGVGLSMTPETAVTLGSLAPVMVLATALGVGCAVLATPFLARLAGISPATAYFSLLPGGIIEMATIGEGHQANRSVIAALHAIRVGLLVILIPLGLFWLHAGDVLSAGATTELSLLSLSFVLLTGLAGGLLFARLQLPAAFLLGPLVFVGVLTSTGVSTWSSTGAPNGALGGGLPEGLLVAAQVVLGFALGARFRRQELSAIPRAVIGALMIFPVIILVMALIGGGFQALLPSAS